MSEVNGAWYRESSYSETGWLLIRCVHARGQRVTNELDRPTMIRDLDQLLTYGNMHLVDLDSVSPVAHPQLKGERVERIRLVDSLGCGGDEEVRTICGHIGELPVHSADTIAN
jgi:hypothetical protein